VGRLIAAELRKTRTRWLPWVLLVVLLLGAGAQVWLFGYTAWWDIHNELDPEVRDDVPTAIHTFVLPWALPALLDAGQFWGALITGILVASVVATEYNWGTVRHAVARGQSRDEWLVVKLAGLVLIAAMMLITTLVWGVVSIIWTSSLAGFEVTLDAGSAELTAAGIVAAMLRAGMGIVPYALLAFALTTIGRSTALGATGIILFMIIETTVVGIFGALGGVWADLRTLTIAHSASSLLAANRLDDGPYVSLALRDTPDPGELLDPWLAFFILCAWCAGLLAATFYVFRRRDLRLGTGE
jgi:ABC-type transport system involved in multi-copper enzyme maturation permease subunit